MQCRRMGNDGCGQFPTLCLCHSLLFTLFPAPLRFPCHGIVFHQLLQRGSFLYAAVQELLQFGPLPQYSPSGTNCSHMDCGSCQKTCSCVSYSPQAAACFRACPPAAARAPPRAVCGCLLHYLLPWGAGRGPASPWPFPRAARASTLAAGASSLILHWPWCLQGCFSHIFSLLFHSWCTQLFTLKHFSPLNTLSQRGHQRCWWVCVRSVLELVGISSVWYGAPPDAFSQKPTL